MASQILRNLSLKPPSTALFRTKTTSSEYVASRARDPTFEKFMDNYKNYLKAVAIQDLILASPSTVDRPSLSLDFLNRLSQKLHLNRGATAFVRRYPHVFDVFCDPSKSQPFCRLTDSAVEISSLESSAIISCLPLVVDRLIRILSMSLSKSVPLRALFKCWKELGLPDDFEDSVIASNPQLFARIDNAHEPGTHILKLIADVPRGQLTAAVENWRVLECCNENCRVDRTTLQYSFKHGYPPGMRTKKVFKAKVREWQSLPYIGPYEEIGEIKKTKFGIRQMEKRAVGIVHEFLNLTVEKMVEVEKITHFRKSFGIDFNLRDLVLDHPGIFYLSTKGKRHTIFLREAYERGCLIEPNPVYQARRKLLYLILLGKRRLFKKDSHSRIIGQAEDRND